MTTTDTFMSAPEPPPAHPADGRAISGTELAAAVAAIKAALVEAIREELIVGLREGLAEELREELGEQLAPLAAEVEAVQATIADRRRKADWLGGEPIPYGHNSEPMLTTGQAARLFGYKRKENFIAAMRAKGISPRRVNARRFLWDRARIEGELRARERLAWA